MTACLDRRPCVWTGLYVPDGGYYRHCRAAGCCRRIIIAHVAHGLWPVCADPPAYCGCCCARACKPSRCMFLCLLIFQRHFPDPRFWPCPVRTLGRATRLTLRGGGRLEISTTCDQTSMGECVGIVGNGNALGNWKVCACACQEVRAGVENMQS